MTVVYLSPYGSRLRGLLLVTVRELGGAGGGAGVGAGGGAVDGLAPHHHQAGGRFRSYYSWNAKFISFPKFFPKNFSKEDDIYHKFVLSL
jgi:hypothetical protein